jgi:hypothetical protein
MTGISPDELELSFRVRSGCYGAFTLIEANNNQPKPPAEPNIESHSQGCDRRRADTSSAAAAFSIWASTLNPLPWLPGQMTTQQGHIL